MHAIIIGKPYISLWHDIYSVHDILQNDEFPKVIYSICHLFYDSMSKMHCIWIWFVVFYHLWSSAIFYIIYFMHSVSYISNNLQCWYSLKEAVELYRCLFKICSYISLIRKECRCFYFLNWIRIGGSCFFRKCFISKHFINIFFYKIYVKDYTVLHFYYSKWSYMLKSILQQIS